MPKYIGQLKIDLITTIPYNHTMSSIMHNSNQYHPIANAMRQIFLDFLRNNNLSIEKFTSNYKVVDKHPIVDLSRIETKLFDFLEDKSDWRLIEMPDELHQDKFMQLLIGSNTYKNNKKVILSHIVKTIKPSVVLLNIPKLDKIEFLQTKKCLNAISWTDKEHFLFLEVESQLEKFINNQEKTKFLISAIRNNNINMHNLKNQTLLFNLVERNNIQTNDKTITNVLNKFKNKSIEESFIEKAMYTYFIDYKAICAVISHRNIHKSNNINKQIDKMMKYFTESFSDKKLIEFLGLDNKNIEKIIINSDGMTVLSQSKIPLDVKNNIKRFSMELLKVLEQKIVNEVSQDPINVKMINNQILKYLKLSNQLDKNEDISQENKQKKNKI